MNLLREKKGSRETSPDAVGCKSHLPHYYVEKAVGFIPAALRSVFCVS
jgi:hypothetical protein